MKLLAIIPARYASTRLPGKPLIDLCGKPMIQWVYEQATQVYNDVLVATDDERIMKCVQRFNGACVMTREDHVDGTSRVLEAYEKSEKEVDFIVNIQGDEPLIAVEMLRDLNRTLTDKSIDVSTLISPVETREELDSVSEVFVVKDTSDYAMYFSRTAIPALKDIDRKKWFDHHLYYKHVGLYAYRASHLRKLVELPTTTYEQLEGLEQLRWLENGYKIKTGISCHETIPVDIPEDVIKVKQIMERRKDSA